MTTIRTLGQTKGIQMLKTRPTTASDIILGRMPARNSSQVRHSHTLRSLREVARITWEPWEQVVSSTLHSLEDQRYSRANAFYTAMKQVQQSLIEVATREKELQVAMEELQATNEEMEASNEELQATAEALQAANDEMERNSLFRQTVMDALRDVLIIVDMEGVVTEANPEAERVFDRPVSEMVGQPIASLLLAGQDGGLAALLRQEAPLAEGGMREAVGRRKDGVTVPLDIAISDMRLADQRWFVVLLRDITERKRTEAALQQKSAELVRSNAELEQFAHLAAHEMQEPLRMVVSYLRLIEQRYKDKFDEDGVDFLDFAVDGAQRMNALVDDLLKYALVQTEVDMDKHCDLEMTIERAKLNVHAAVEEVGAEITVGRLPIVNANPSQITQLFTNLLGNAIKFHGRHIDITATPEGSDWLFRVRDDGIGVAKANHERIFSMFHRLHTIEEYPGSGMGLAICKKIVESYQGRIWVESELNEGSTFCFTLPAVRGRDKTTDRSAETDAAD